MNKPDWILLRTIVFDIAKILQDGKHSTSEQWQDIADELDRAATIAQTEAERLYEQEND